MLLCNYKFSAWLACAAPKIHIRWCRHVHRYTLLYTVLEQVAARNCTSCKTCITDIEILFIGCFNRWTFWCMQASVYFWMDPLDVKHWIESNYLRNKRISINSYCIYRVNIVLLPLKNTISPTTPTANIMQIDPSTEHFEALLLSKIVCVLFSCQNWI